MKGIGQSISVLLRTERLIARRRVSVLRNQAVLLLCAALIGGMAVIMLNLAGFYGLRSVLPPYWAALIVAGVNLILAGVIVAFALGRSSEAEADQTAELRDQAIQRIEDELDATMGDIRQATENLNRLARDPLGTAAPALLAPLLAKLLEKPQTDDSDTA